MTRRRKAKDEKRAFDDDVDMARRGDRDVRRRLGNRYPYETSSDGWDFGADRNRGRSRGTGVYIVAGVAAVICLVVLAGAAMPADFASGPRSTAPGQNNPSGFNPFFEPLENPDRAERVKDMADFSAEHNFGEVPPQEVLDERARQMECLQTTTPEDGPCT